jgi:hypothetical protein
MADNQNETTSRRGKFFRTVLAAPLIATFALGATAIPASANVPNAFLAHEAVCLAVALEPFANKPILLALLGCLPPPKGGNGPPNGNT